MEGQKRAWPLKRRFIVGGAVIALVSAATVAAFLHFRAVPIPANYTIVEKNGESVVIDTDTGLMWQRSVVGPEIKENRLTKIGFVRSREEAMQYCDELSYAGYTDWHLPNIDEMRTILPEGCKSKHECKISNTCTNHDKCWNKEECGMCGKAFEGPGEDGYYWDRGLWTNDKERKNFWTTNIYWTSTTLNDDFIGGYSYGVQLCFATGEIGAQGLIGGDNSWVFVRCVRNLK